MRHELLVFQIFFDDLPEEGVAESIPRLNSVKTVLLMAMNLELCQTFVIELYSKNSQRLLAVNYFRLKALSNMFEWALNTPFIYGKKLFISNRFIRN